MYRASRYLVIVGRPYDLSRGNVIARILITGASGFVGRHLLTAFSRLEHPDIEIIAACRDTSRLPPEYAGEVRCGDLRDPGYRDRMLVGVDIICHTAGWLNFSRDTDASSRYALEPTIDLIRTAIEWRISRFVNLSSLSVVPPDLRLQEDSIGKPRKHCAMQNCLIAIEDYMRANATIGCTFANLRAGIVCGPQQTYGVWPVLLQLARQGRLSLAGSASEHLPLVDVRDLAQAFIRAALAPGLPGYSDITVVGYETPAANEVFRFIQQQPGVNITPDHTPQLFSRIRNRLNAFTTNHEGFGITPSLLAYLNNPWVNNRKAIDLLAFDPQFSWQASLIDYFENDRSASINQLHQARPPKLD